MSDTWPTAITRIEPNKVAVRGRDIASLMGSASFGGAVYLLLTGRDCSAAVARLMDAVLVSSIDHGATPPSALAARNAASTGASLSACVAAGILSINRHHGGAIEDCARELGKIVARAREGTPLEQAAKEALAGLKAEGRFMPGFGHRVHTNDPRTARLFELAAEAGLGGGGSHIEAAKAVERAFAAAGRPLPINVDGAIAAVLADLGIEPGVMNGVFMIARTPGLIAHAHEERTRMKPMRRIDPDPAKQVYDGP